MSPLPKYLLISIPEAYASLDHLARHTELPTVDTEAILSGVFELLAKPGLSGQALDNGVNYLLDIHGLRELHIEEEDHDVATDCFYECLISIRQTLADINPYHQGTLPFQYKARRGTRNAILELIPPPRQ